jgi:hypothetical protein
MSLLKLITIMGSFQTYFHRSKLIDTTLIKLSLDMDVFFFTFCRWIVQSIHETTIIAGLRVLPWTVLKLDIYIICMPWTVPELDIYIICRLRA